MVAGSALTSPTNALVAEEVEDTEEEDTLEEEVTVEEDTVDNPATEEDTNKVASVDNNLATVDKVDTEEEMLPTVPVNPLVTVVTTVPVLLTEDKPEVTANNNNPVTLNKVKVTEEATVEITDKLKVELKAVTEEDTKRFIQTFSIFLFSQLFCFLFPLPPYISLSRPVFVHTSQ